MLLKNSPLLAALLFASTGPALPASPACVATALSEKEAEQLVLLANSALAAQKIGGKLFAMFYEPPNSGESYNVMVTSTISPPGAPIDNGLVGYYAVSKATGRVLNIALREEKGKELVALQRKLRTKHCVSAEMVKTQRDGDDYERDDDE